MITYISIITVEAKFTNIHLITNKYMNMKTIINMNININNKTNTYTNINIYKIEDIEINKDMRKIII